MGRAARLVALLVVALSVIAAPARAADPSLHPRVELSAGERDFIAKHWGRAIPPQGLAPARFSPIERNLFRGTHIFCGAAPKPTTAISWRRRERTTRCDSVWSTEAVPPTRRGPITLIHENL